MGENIIFHFGPLMELEDMQLSKSCAVRRVGAHPTGATWLLEQKRLASARTHVSWW